MRRYTRRKNLSGSPGYHPKALLWELLALKIKRIVGSQTRFTVSV
jgi:hypothetical protein